MALTEYEQHNLERLRAAAVARIVRAKLKVMPTSRPKSARSAAA